MQTSRTAQLEKVQMQAASHCHYISLLQRSMMTVRVIRKSILRKLNSEVIQQSNLNCIFLIVICFNTCQYRIRATENVCPRMTWTTIAQSMIVAARLWKPNARICLQVSEVLILSETSEQMTKVEYPAVHSPKTIYLAQCLTYPSSCSVDDLVMISLVSFQQSESMKMVKAQKVMAQRLTIMKMAMLSWELSTSTANWYD